MEKTSRNLPPEKTFSPILWLVVAAMLGYATALPGGFVWLDHTEIVGGGYRVESGAQARQVWTQTLDQFSAGKLGAAEPAGGYWRPVQAWSITLDWLLFGARPWMHRLENIAWHLTIVLGLYRLGCAWLTDRRPVFWGTLLFAVHPVGVHSVTWISGRKDLLCAAFGVAALLALRAAGTRHDRATQWGWGLVAVAATVLAIGSKETGLIIPLLATALVWPALPPSQRAVSWRRRIAGGVLMGMWVVAGLLAAYRVVVLGNFGLDAGWPVTGWWDRLGLMARIFTSYAVDVLVPHVASVSDSVRLDSPWTVLHILLIVAGLTGLVMLTRRRWPGAPFLWWCVIWLLPVSGVVELRHWRAERYLYPAMWGALVAVCFWLRAYRWQPVAAALFAACLLYGNTLWWSDERLFADAVRRDPEFREGRVALGNLALARGDFAAAVEQYRDMFARRAAGTHYSYFSPLVAHNNLGIALYRLGRYDEAIPEFVAARELRPRQFHAPYHLGLIALAKGKLESARAFFEMALEASPGHPDALSNLAFAELQLGNFRECIRLLTPLANNDRNRINLASAHLAEKHYAAARTLLETMPTNAVAQAKLAWCQWQQGERAAARATLERARALAPADPAVELIARQLAALDRDGS